MHREILKISILRLFILIAVISGIVFLDRPTGINLQAQETSNPITVVNYRKIPVGENIIDCEYTYSDGSLQRWHWQLTNPQGTWTTDPNGQNGHYEPSTQTVGTCDNTIIGSLKRFK